MLDLPSPGLRPAESIAAAAVRFGEDEIRAWCLALLAGEEDDVAPGRPAILWLGGTVGWVDYWTRVWGARGLLHLGPGDAGPTLIAALGDPSWRVREMSLKVITRHAVADPDARIEPLLEDPVERVRVQAMRALGAPRDPA